MNKSVQMIVTLTTNDLRNLISDVLEEKLFRIKAETKEAQKDASLISRLEVANLFGVSTTTIDKWRRYKILPPSVKISSRVYFKKDEITLMFNRRQNNPTEFLTNS
jgi:predicted DNA-binding transcriptional regulator AlpA